jgi:hypothetical protein
MTLPALEVDVLHPELEAFGEPHAVPYINCAISACSPCMPSSTLWTSPRVSTVGNRLGFFARATLPATASRLQHTLVQEEDGRQGLVLRWGGLRG